MKVTNHIVSNKSTGSYKSSTLAKHVKAARKTTDSKAPKKKTAPQKNASGSIFSALGSPRALQVYGIIFMAFALLLFISICSFYFHPNDNISHVEADTDPRNIAGTVGAHLSYFFLEYSFGIFSIGFPFLFFLYGVRLTFNKTLLPLVKTTITTLLTMSWISVFAGLFCYKNAYDFISGSFGNYLAGLLLDNLGNLVTALIMIVLFAAILILCYDFTPKLYTRKSAASADATQEVAPAQNNSDKPKHKLSDFFKKKNKTQPAQTERQELPGLYIEDRAGISKEYHGKTYEFSDEEATELRTKTDISGTKSPKNVGCLVSNESDLDQYDNPTTPRSTPKPAKEVPLEIIDNKLSPAPAEESENEDTEPEITDIETATAKHIKELEPFDPKKELSHYQFPPLDLLNDYPAKEASEELMRKELIDNKKRIESTLKSFSIPIKRITATVGPTVTLYEIVPDDGVRISKIKNLEDDIALSLSALGIRIIAPIPGRGTIGIEVPNKNPNIVSMKEVIASERFKTNHYELPIGLGKTINNEPFVVDLAKMPHLLIAGATGQGKSVGLNAAITSLLYTKHPCEIKFVLVDPKKVEFTLYAGIENYYLAKLPGDNEAIINDNKKVVRTLNALCSEMDQRYDLLKLAKTRNIKEYNAKFCARGLSPALGHRYLPYIVLIIDEFGDLIMTAGREVEVPLARLAQLARAIGIHLIIATQRPSVNIITGSIKANFPARIAFRVSSKIDSRTILDSSGADQLIGKGDMLISTGSDLIRLQCAFVDTPEVEKVVNFIEEQSELKPLLEPFELPDIPDNSDDPNANSNDDFANPNDIDPLLLDAATLIVQTQQGSTSFIQRRMKLGYNRAGRIMDQLEDFGIVGASNGSKAREVLIKTETALHELFNQKGFYN